MMVLVKEYVFILCLAFMFFLTVPVFAALGEVRLDVYFSMFTLEYFIAYALFRPRRRFRDLIGPALFIIFIYIVALRVLEVLGW